MSEKDKVILDSFNSGEWCNSQDICRLLNITFAEGFQKFEFSRTAEWWSVVGETEEERQKNGQKITTMFRLKRETDYGAN